MSVFAAVMTGKGTGAIATIQLYGDSAASIIRQIFSPQSAELTTGKILLGIIRSGSETIDQVTIGCEGPGTFAINCHGNPLIVEEIMQLLQQQGVKLLTAEQLLCKTSAGSNTIALEARLTLPKAKTIQGTQIILNQIDSGLTASAKNWLQNPPGKIAAEAQKIIEASKIAKLIIFGCRIVLAGPPNTGKSTLLNQLCGRQKAIVTDIKGTTRDWVSANCQIACGEQSRTGSLAIELIDTAGLDNKLASDIEKAAQQTATELINQADIVLLVLDNSEPAGQIEKSLINKLAGRKVLTVLNKTDLPCRFKISRAGLAPWHGLPARANTARMAVPPINISAKLGTGIDRLCDEIQQLAGVENFDPNQPVCFTSRQEQLLTQLSTAKSKDAACGELVEPAHSLITELLSGPLNKTHNADNVIARSPD